MRCGGDGQNSPQQTLHVFFCLCISSLTIVFKNNVEKQIEPDCHQYTNIDLLGMLSTYLHAIEF